MAYNLQEEAQKLAQHEDALKHPEKYLKSTATMLRGEQLATYSYWFGYYSAEKRTARVVEDLSPP